MANEKTADNLPKRRDLLRAGLTTAIAATVAGAASSALTAQSESAREVKAGSLEDSLENSLEGSLEDKDGISVAMLVFDGITQLDATGPMEVFAKAGLEVFTVAPRQALVTAGCGLKIMPDYDYESAPRADILCVPGGGGVNPLLTDSATINYLQRAASQASYTTSVCTGALLLGAAGLLKGKRATTHWASHHFLGAFGAIPINERVVVDGTVITGGGVTAGIDFGFSVLDEILGRDAGSLAMLALEYDPAPPFASGSPGTAPAHIIVAYNEVASKGLAKRGEQVALAAAKL